MGECIMKKLLLTFFIAFGLIGSTWALQVFPTAIAFACENTGLVVEEVQYLRDDGRLCGESLEMVSGIILSNTLLKYNSIE